MSLILRDLIHFTRLLNLLFQELNYVRRFAHCADGDGFVVFDRYDASKEVWHIASEYNTSLPPAISLPDSRQSSDMSLKEA